MIKTAKIPEREFIREGDHLIGEFIGDQEGPTLIVIGSIHGNEPAGIIALKKVATELALRKTKFAGRAYFLAGNTRAFSQSLRFIGADLNRYWTALNVEKKTAEISEDDELHELKSIFDEIFSTARNEVFVVDLHSTSSESMPFGTLGDTLRNRHFARKFPAMLLLGIEEQLDGTMLEYLNNAGAVTLGFEGGQHDSPKTVENHESLIWLSLVNAGLISDQDEPAFEFHEKRLRESIDGHQFFEVRHREAIEADDGFQMKPGYRSFDQIRRLEELACNHKGKITAKESGLILMPLYQKQGNDGFFIGREVSVFWLWLSEIVRNLNFSKWLHILPGVNRGAINNETLFIDTHVARFFPLQVFHLLGFRKLRWNEDQLVVSRRKHDTKSPFTPGKELRNGR